MSLIPPRPDIPEVAGLYDLNTRRDLKAARDKIADLEARLGITPAVDHVGHRKPHSTSNCRFHLAVFVDEDTRKVTCRWCGIELDAVTVLLELAKKERRFCYWSEALRKEQAELRVEVDALKKQRSSLKSQIKKRGK